MVDTPVVTEDPTEPRQLSREEAYQHLTVMLDRLDRDVNVMIQGAGSAPEVSGLWDTRYGLLDAQRGLSSARRASAENLPTDG